MTLTQLIQYVLVKSSEFANILLTLLLVFHVACWLDCTGTKCTKLLLRAIRERYTFSRNTIFSRAISTLE